MWAFDRYVMAAALGLCSAALGCSASGDGASPPPGVGAGSAFGEGAAGAGGAPVMGVSGGAGVGNEQGSGGTLAFGAGGTSAAAGGASNTVGAGACSGVPQTPADKAAAEVCGNGLDDDLNGFVDENCQCNRGVEQACFVGTALQASAEGCHKGTQKCAGSTEFPAWGPCEGAGCGVVVPKEVCDNGVDDNCDGRIDEGCTFDMTVAIDGDCLGIPCPPQAPNPVGCQIDMQGGDSRGCVAHAAGNNAVYFQEGDACPIPGCELIGACGNSGHISGSLKCSASPTPVTLGETNCAINKTDRIYTDNPGGCP